MCTCDRRMRWRGYRRWAVPWDRVWWLVTWRRWWRTSAPPACAGPAAPAPAAARLLTAEATTSAPTGRLLLCKVIADTRSFRCSELCRLKVVRLRVQRFQRRGADSPQLGDTQPVEHSARAADQPPCQLPLLRQRRCAAGASRRKAPRAAGALAPGACDGGRRR